MGLLTTSHRWLVLKALYGLRQAPLAWARFRDKSKKELTFECEGVVYILLQGVSDDSIWFIAKREVPAEDKDRWHGVLIIYVDDLLGFATTAILRELFAAVRRLWKLSDPQWVTIDAPISFCGLEIQAIEGGFKISQRAYLKELFSRYDVQSSVSSPLSSWRDPEDEHPLNPDAVRQAQALTGALLWASTKSRPDIAFAVSKLGQFAVKAPSTVIEKGFQVLKYLYGTDDLWIEYRRPSGSLVVDAPVPRTLTTLELFTDASHAPEGGRSCQAIVITWCSMLLCWESSKQPFVTLSSAESELVAVTAGIVAAESVAAIIEELIGQDVLISAMCDNQATVRVFAVGHLGWRSRHLRMRAAAARERIQVGSLVMTFIPGDGQVADIATKPLGRPRIMQLLRLLGVQPESHDGSEGSARVMSRLSLDSSGPCSLTPRALAGLALVAAVPRVKGQPNEVSVEDSAGWLSGLVGLLVLVAALIWAWWFVGRFRDHIGNSTGHNDMSAVGGCDDASEVEGSPFGCVHHNGNFVDLQFQAHGTEPELINQDVQDCTHEVEGSGEESQVSDPGSDVFDAVEWEESRKALIERELYTGLTFVQRARLRQQLFKGDLVEVPNMMQRYGALPGWYAGFEDDGISSSQDVPIPQVQVGGSSSSQDVPIPQVQVGGSSSSQDVPIPQPQIGGSSSSQDVLGSQVGLDAALALTEVLAGNAVSFVESFGRGLNGLRIWLRLRAVCRVLQNDPTLASARGLCDTGLGPAVSNDSVPNGVIRFVQVGDRFQWVLVAVGPVGLGDSGRTEDISGEPAESRPDGQSAGSHEQYRDYEDCFGDQDELADVVFPLVDNFCPRHFLDHVFSLQGDRVLSYLGERTPEWGFFVSTSGLLRYTLVWAVVDRLRAGVYGHWFSGPQGLAVGLHYVATGEIAGIVDVQDAYFQAESDHDDASDDSRIDDIPHVQRRDQEAPVPPVHWARFFEAGDFEELSEDGSSTAEPSIDSQSSSAVSAVSSVVRECEPADPNFLRQSDAVVSNTAYAAGEEGFRVLYGDDEFWVPLTGWDQGSVEAVVVGLNNGDWSSFQELSSASSSSEALTDAAVGQIAALNECWSVHGTIAIILVSLLTVGGLVAWSWLHGGYNESAGLGLIVGWFLSAYYRCRFGCSWCFRSFGCPRGFSSRWWRVLLWIWILFGFGEPAGAFKRKGAASTLSSLWRR